MVYFLSEAVSHGIYFCQSKGKAQPLEGKSFKT